MAEGAMYYTGPGLELARRRQEEQRKKRGGLLELLARGMMVPGNVLQQQLSELPEALGVSQLPKAAEAVKGLDTRISGYEDTTPQKPFPVPGEEGFMGPVQPKAPAVAIPDLVPNEDFVGPQQLGRALPASAEITREESDMERRIREAEENKAGSDKKQLALSVIEGLIRGGAEASNVRGLSDILAGQARRPADQSTADQLAKVRELMGEKSEKALEAAKNPIVDMINKEYGTKFETPEQAREFMALKKTKADIAETEGQTAARKETLDLKKTADQQEAQKVEAEQRKSLYDARTEFRKLPMFRAQEDALTKVERVLAALETDNPSVIQTEAIAMARAAGEVGNLSQEERYVFVRFPGLKGWMNTVEEFATSKPTEENKERLRDLAMTYKKHSTRAMKDLVDREIGSYTSSHPDANPEFVKEQFKSLIPQITTTTDDDVAPEGKRWVVITKAFGENEVGDKKLIDEDDYENGKEFWD